MVKWKDFNGKDKINGYSLIFVPELLNLTQRVKYINDRCVDGDVCIELHLDAFIAKE